VEELSRLLLAPDPILAWQTVLQSELLAFVLGTAIAWVYVKTHRGLSYSRSFVQALVLGALVAAMLMLAVGNNMARGIGILGTLAIIRFRSSLKDPRDMIFVFGALAIGIAMGVRAFMAGILGTALFAAASFLLNWSAFGTRRQFDGLLSFQAVADGATDDRVKTAMARHCGAWVLVALREVAQGAGAEHSYHVRLSRADGEAALVADLQGIKGVRGVSFYAQDATEDL
jgi:uncharacterized membrane protein YhiD involved in acid resistance